MSLPTAPPTTHPPPSRRAPHPSPPALAPQPPAPPSPPTDPTEPACLSDDGEAAPLRTLCARDPLTLEVWRSLHGKTAQRFRNALTSYTASVRVACATAFLEARLASAAGSDTDAARSAAAAAEAARATAHEILHACPAAATRINRKYAHRMALLSTALLAILGPDSQPSPPPAQPERLPAHTAPLHLFEHASHMFIASLAAGWPLSNALSLWAPVQSGSFSASGKTFMPGPRTPQQPQLDPAECEVRSFPRGPGEPVVGVYILRGSIRAITSSASLRVAKQPRARDALSLADLPAFIALPRDSEGRPIIPKSRVTALVEAQDAWQTELGKLDHLTSTITRGQLVMPKLTTPSQRKVLRNHPSWEDDPAAQVALGPIIAKWLAQGVLEYVEWDDRQPVLLQPCGAVPKGSAPFYRLITDARFGNSMFSDWGVTYTSAADLSAALQHRDFTWSADLQDAYHLSVFAGCGGVLRPIQRPIVHGDGTISWIDGLVNGCTPGSCLGGCDKDMSGLCINGHVFRFAACQFGQKTAGSPLNSLVMSVARYFSHLSDPVHVAAWVDDLHFSMRTPPHPPCAGFEGGCPTCAAAYAKACSAEQIWLAKARVLNLPLSDGKGHSVHQGGPFTGVFIDTFIDRYLMLPDKLEGILSNFSSMIPLSDSTPRALARSRGKAFHYGCAVQYLRIPCASLTQAIHRAELPGSASPPDLHAERDDPNFDWDQSLVISSRTRAALSALHLIASQMGEAGQPLWPPPPASLYGTFLSGRPSPTPIAVLSVFVLPAGWGFSIRTTPSAPAYTSSGPWEDARGLLDAPWMAPGPLLPSSAPSCLVQQHALACLLSLHAASRLLNLGPFQLLLRCGCEPALLALSKGDPRNPSLQDISMLFLSACLQLRIRQPLVLTTPLGQFLRPTPPNAGILAILDSATPKLRTLAHSLASGAGHRFTIDLFATHSNTLTPRFYSAWAEPRAEAQDALSQLDWSQSFCPTCQKNRADFVFLYPPFELVPLALRKAQVDQAHGILVVPFASTAPWWPTILNACNRTRRHRTRPVRIPCSPEYVENQSNPAGYYITALHFDFWQDPTPRPRACPHGHLANRLSAPGPCPDQQDRDLLYTTSP